MNKRLVLLAISILAPCVVAGCSQSEEPIPSISNESSSETPTPGDDVTIYDQNGNVVSIVPDPNRPVTAPLAKQVLEDGVVTAEENAEVDQLYKECLEAGGVTEVEFGEGGRMRYRVPDWMTPEQSDQLDRQCGGPDGTGWNAVSSLYWESVRNPDHIDYSILMSDCLARVGLFPEGYTPEQYMSDLRNDTFPFPNGIDNEKFRQCNDDPLHAK